jgi:hypothetical protein
MTNKIKESKLKRKLLKNRELYSTIGKKPQGLEPLEIRKRVEGFLLNQGNLKDSFAFGEGVAVGNTEKNRAQFDPVESYNNQPSRIDNIIMLVDHDMCCREAELINEAENFKGSYNTLLFGIAIKLAHDHKLSDPLREFLIEHLISPPDNQKKSIGRPKVTTLDERFRYQAIEFARLHGLKPTRNDGTSAQNSACDVVSAAATALCQFQIPGFNQGYGFESLKKIWNKYSKS